MVTVLVVLHVECRRRIVCGVVRGAIRGGCGGICGGVPYCCENWNFCVFHPIYVKFDMGDNIGQRTT